VSFKRFVIGAACLLGLLCSMNRCDGQQSTLPAQSATMPAQLVIKNAVIRTMHPERPTAEALAVRDSRIVAMGGDIEIQRYVGKETRVIDAQGRLVLPGFNDAHVHFLSGGQQLSSVQLRDAQSLSEFRDRIGKFAASKPPQTWITGGDWDHENWPGAPLPTRQTIDDVTGEHPVFVTRLDGHMGLANSIGLKLGNITKETPDPPGGLIVRDESGEPTGVLKDAAMALVSSQIPDLSRDERLAAAKAATDHAASLGVTSVQDMSGGRDVSTYAELQNRGELKTRVYVAVPLSQWERSAAAGLTAATGTPWLRQGALKGFADGSLGSTTALFFDPYTDAPQTRGLPSDEMVREGEMMERIEGADKAGLQIMVHAIGDKANDQMLSIYETVIRKNGPRDRRFRIEHAQHLRKEDISRFGSSRMIASMQPYHCADDGRWADKRIGPERLSGTYAFRSLLDHHAALAFGSDWNVAPLDPIQGLAAAVTRQTLDGKHAGGWIPEQKISIEEAVRAYTVGSAQAEFQEQEKGMLAVGMLADMVMLSADIFSIAPSEITSTHVVMTFVDGREVYRAN
jgi:predicted amidohydrolase YtcJ